MNLIQKINHKNKISLYPLIESKNIFFSIYKSFKDKKNDFNKDSHII